MPAMVKMPILFVGHGMPMNAIENNEYTENWIKMAARIPQPSAILSVSAHWYTRGTHISDAENPVTVYDMYGFPKELYRVKYEAKGAPALAHRVKEIIGSNAVIDNSHGFDHGMWSVLSRIYPKANIPVCQLSVDGTLPAESHFRLGQHLRVLRESGVLIFGSGNIVHNMSKINWDMKTGYPWAEEFDRYIKENILARQYENVLNYENAGPSAALAFFSPDHFFPLLYVLGASDEKDTLDVFNDSCLMGSLSMTSYYFY